jgi:hypothetical protein
MHRSFFQAAQSRCVWAALVTLASGLGCASAESGPEGTLVVGIQAEGLAGTGDNIHVTTSLRGGASSESTLPLAASSSQFVSEVPVKGPVGAEVDVVVELRRGTAPVLVRRAHTRVPSTQRLLRLQLDSRCATSATFAGSAASAPSCNPSQTCSLGQCVAIDVAESEIEPFEANWALSPPDICRPANHGPPEVIIGTGQTDFGPLTDGQTLQLERGPQGGHHLWIAARMKNLRQSGSRTVLTAKVVEPTSSNIAPAAYVFTFDRDEGGYCKLFGLRFQLDSGAVDLGTTYKQFLGKKLEITVEVIDSTNARASSTKTIQIADKLLCPDGTTTSCNG